MNFEEYLRSKKIDSAAFRQAEPDTWKTWAEEFPQMHPASFTAQKLYLINPVRRKYRLRQEEPPAPVAASAQAEVAAPAPVPSPAKPAAPRPVFKPKPKIN